LAADIAGITVPTAVQIRQEIDTNSTQLAAIVADTNELQLDNVPGLIAALNDLSIGDVSTLLGGLNDLSTADIAAQLALYDAPTKAEMDTAFAALNDPSVAQIWGQVIDGTYTAAQVMYFLFSEGVMKFDATTGTFYAADGTTVTIQQTSDVSGNRSAPTLTP